MGVRVVLKKDQVFITYSAGSDRKFFAVKPTVKVTPSQIDLKNRVVKTGVKKFDKESTESIQKLYLWFLQAVEKIEKYEKRIASVQAVSSLYEEEFINSGSSEAVQKLDFWSNFNDFMSFKRTEVSDSTFKQYNVIERKRLENFLERYKNKYSSIDQIDNQFLIHFKQYFIEERKLGAASYSQLVSLFKSFMKYLIRVKLLRSELYELITFHLKRKDYENNKDFALTINELKALYEFNDLPRWQKRNLDYFICNCLLGGLRWGDFKELNWGEVSMLNKKVSVFSRKTNKQLTFPIFDFAYEIIKKYNPNSEILDTKQKVFKELNNLNVFNRSLKEAAARFYILDYETGEKKFVYRETKICTVQNVQGFKQSTKSLADLFKASMARRTFISIMRRSGYGFEEVRSFTGHQNVVTFTRYSKVNEDDQRIMVEKAFSKLNSISGDTQTQMRIAK